jgi:hypothetical protein
VSIREVCLAAAAAIVVTIALTWPIAPRLGSAGRVDSGDGRYSIWNVAWVAHALTTDPSRVYDANIFSPHGNTLAFSEANLVAGAIASPVWLATKNPYAASNFVILASFVLSALVTYALAHRLTSSVPAAVVAAIGFAYCPYVFSHIPHVQLLMTFGLPLVLLLMHRFVEVPSPQRAIALGAGMAFAGLACGYYGIFGGLMAALGVVWFGAAGRHWRDARYWLAAALAALVAAAIVLPFLMPYAAIQSQGFERTLEEARLFSVRWRSYLASPMMLHRWMLPYLQAWGSWREVLFPGFVIIGLAAMAVWQTFGSRSAARLVAPRSIVGFYVAVAGLAAWASLGPDFGLYAVLYETLPFFSLLRAPARFGVLVTLAAALLAGIGFANALQPLVGLRRAWVRIAIIAIVLAKHVVGPLAMPGAPQPTEAHRRLAQLPVGVVAEFPYFVSRIDRHRHTEYMLMSTLHWKPLINGYSDHTPDDVWRDMPKLAAFPGQEAWRVLHNHRVRFVMVHWRLYAPDERRQVLLQVRGLAPFLRSIVDADSVSLYEIVGWPDGANADTTHPF